MNDLIASITEEQISTLREHLQLFLEQIKVSANANPNQESESGPLCDSCNDDTKSKLLAGSCFWNYEKLAVLSLQLLQKVKITMAEKTHDHSLRTDLILENDSLKRRVSELKRSLENVNDNFDKNQSLLECLIQEKDKENQNQILTDGLNSFNKISAKLFCNHVQNEGEEIKRVFASKQRELYFHKQRQKQFQSEIFCLNHQLKRLGQQVKVLQVQNSLLRHDVDVKKSDYQYLHQKMEVLTQQVNFYRLPDKLQYEQFEDYRQSYLEQPQFLVQRQNESFGDGDFSQNLSIYSGSGCRTDRTKYKKTLLSKEIAHQQQIQVLNQLASWSPSEEEPHFSDTFTQSLNSFKLHRGTTNCSKHLFSSQKIFVDFGVNTEQSGMKSMTAAFSQTMEQSESILNGSIKSDQTDTQASVGTIKIGSTSDKNRKQIKSWASFFHRMVQSRLDRTKRILKMERIYFQNQRHSPSEILFTI